MTNEELAVKIQAGHTEYYGELWENVKDLIAYLSNRAFAVNYDKCISFGVTVEDIIQSGFIALTEAVQAFEPRSGYKLSAYITYPLQNQVNILLCRRTSYQDGIAHSISINTPVSGEADDLTIGDTLHDSASENAFKAVEDEMFNRQLKEVLLREIKGLTELEQRIIIDRFYNGLKFADICAKENVTEWKAKGLCEKALRSLGNGQHRKKLQPFADELLGRGLRGVGFGSFERLQASSVELTVEWLEREAANSSNRKG